MAGALDHLAVSPSGFVFDPASGATFTANATARLLLDGVADGLGLAALVRRLEAGFAAPPEVDLSRDVLEFVRAMQDHGLLDRDFELGA